MVTYNHTGTNNRNRNSAKRLLITCVIDISPSTMLKGDFDDNTANALINKNLRQFINQLLANKKIRTSAEISFITYSSKVNVVKEFVPLRTLENNIPHFEAEKTGGTRTASALDKAYEVTRKRAKEITSVAVDSGLYTSVVFLLTDGDISLHDSPEYVDKVTRMMNEATLKSDRTEKVLPFIVGLGSHIHEDSKKILAGFSKGFIEGFFYLPGNTGTAERDFSKLFGFLSESLVATVNVENDNVYCEDDHTHGDTVDALLEELRDLIFEEYPEMVYTVVN